MTTDDRWTAYLFTSMNMGTVQPRSYLSLADMPKLFTVRKVGGLWRVVLTRRNGQRFEARYREGEQALASVRTAFDSGFFLGYPR